MKLIRIYTNYHIIGDIIDSVDEHNIVLDSNDMEFLKRL